MLADLEVTNVADAPTDDHAECARTKVRDGQVTNRPVYAAIGVTVDGHRDILGIWAGEGGEGAKYWPHVLTEIKNRVVADACIAATTG
jgi:transposase-like protein